MTAHPRRYSTPAYRATRPAGIVLRGLPRLAFQLGVAIEILYLLRLIPAGALIALGLALLALLALTFWHPLLTLALITALIASRLERRRRARRAQERAHDDEIPF